MKDEIKEILDKLYLNFEKAGLTAPEYSDLRDYITNLQQIEQEHKKINGELREQIKILEENNQNMQEEMARVWQENSNLKTSLDEAQEVLSEYKEENEELKKKLDRRYYKNEYERIKEENETRQQDINNLTYQLAKMKEENERLKEHSRWLEDKIETYFDNVNMQNDLLIEQLDYKSRCEKAIEYINKNKHLSMFADCRESEEDWNYDLECSANDLLNILQGENNATNKDL